MFWLVYIRLTLFLNGFIVIDSNMDIRNTYVMCITCNFGSLFISIAVDKFYQEIKNEGNKNH